MAMTPYFQSILHVAGKRILSFLEAESALDAVMCVMFYAFIILFLTYFVKIVGGFVSFLFSTVF